MRKRPKQRPELCLALALLLTGCATTRLPVAKVEVLQPEEVSRRPVVVLSDPYMQNFELADRLRESFRQECVQRGFDVKSTEYDADLVIVPSMAASVASESISPAPRRALLNPRLFDTTRDSLGNSGMLRVSSSSSVVAARVALVVSAYRKQDWLDPQFIDAPMPKAWRIVAIEPRHEGGEMEQVPTLVAACGKGLGQLAASAGNGH